MVSVVFFIVYRAAQNVNPRLSAASYNSFARSVQSASDLSRPGQAAHLSRMKAYDYLDGDDPW